MDSVNPKYLHAMHEAIDSYELPNYLLDRIEEGETNDDENNRTNGDTELG